MDINENTSISCSNLIFDQIGLLWSVIESYKTETSLLVQLLHDNLDAPSKLLPFACVWSVSNKTFPIPEPVQVPFKYCYCSCHHYPVWQLIPDNHHLPSEKVAPWVPILTLLTLNICIVVVDSTTLGTKTLCIHRINSPDAPL